ncbi:BTAD domain-containing putative transcriptional regulator [Nocardioides sp. cx-173]|uniref:BTAD domain-containing putative transcriptional regulator n=1 Tax=Nocardioides sp. cx-173 TaxID=2898796 RepID=UPI001E5A0D23|nr:BTAD domain-containing putative transcriptional regulator [Nocardioides sp. cx-173]MCD4527381.1 AAA family ATPase [Nocardioides sp. cx-173]UGB42423.1 AAA family ATPase [Nocardioides sp. cx-173]
MRTAVLGPVEVHAGDRIVDLGTRRQRAIVAGLALADGTPVASETLIARVWGADPPPGALATLHGYVAGLRRSLEPDRAPRESPRVLVTVESGYALRTPREGRDDHAVERAVAEARALLRAVPDHLRPRTDAAGAAAVTEALVGLDHVVGLWRGEPYPELGEDPAAEAERARLRDLNASAQELRVVARMALGRHVEVVPELAAKTTEHPLHERWWALLAVALARSGRQAEALQSLQSLRALLADELGVDPSPPVRELHTAILRQDPSLGWSRAPSSALPVRGAGPPMEARPSHFRESPPVPRWPLAGRSEETHRLGEVVTDVIAGRPHVVLLTGEAGVGKSRLALELSLSAFEQGFTVAVGQCSADGPPPLWPWRVIARSLADQLADAPEVVGLLDTAPADDFATWDAVAGALCDAASAHPLLLVLEDVQWADEPTRRLLVHLQSVVRHQRLCVVVTARLDGATDRVVGDLAAALARGQTTRLDLDGLDVDAAGDLVAAVAGSVHRDTVRDLWERAAGNPFFLTELALSGGALSGSLSDVVLSRVRALPDDTVRLLEAASVIDIVVDLDLLSLMTGRSDTETAQLLAPALATGLVVDEGRVNAAYRFSHGVVREAVHAHQPQHTRAAWHRAVSQVLERRSGLRRPDQRAALAHHWELAGYGWVGEAWRSVLVAAEQARLDGAYDEEARLLRRAVGWQELDIGSGDGERFELLILLAEACRWSADWQGVSDAVDEAVVVAERLGDPRLAARAAISTMEGALWQVRPYGTVHHPIVEALERALLALPATEPGLRCRALLALAMELYYGGDQARIDALVEEALAIADGEQEPRLCATAYLGAFSARARADAAADRARYVVVAREAADAVGDGRLRLLADALGASVASELGDVATVRDALPRLSDQCRRRGLATAEAFLRVLEVPWLTMWGDLDQADASLARLGELAQRLRMPNLADALTVTTVARSMLAGEYEQVAQAMADFVADTTIPAGPVAVVVLLRAGQRDLARALHGHQGVDLTDATYVGLVNACLACEIALGLDDRELAARAYPLAAPYAGRMCTAGSAVPIGPVDTFLAWGAKALGKDQAASAHADDAVVLARAWGLSRVESELLETRRRYTV